MPRSSCAERYWTSGNASSVTAQNCRSAGSKAAASRTSACRKGGPSGFPLARSHNRDESIELQTRRVCLSPLKTTDRTGHRLASGTPVGLRSAASQNRTDPSVAPVAAVRPSEANATDQASPRWRIGSPSGSSGLGVPESGRLVAAGEEGLAVGTVGDAQDGPAVLGAGTPRFAGREVPSGHRAVDVSGEQGAIVGAGVWQIFLEPSVRISQDRQGPIPTEVLAMESTPQISRQEFIDRMRQKVEEALGRVADAVNPARPGRIIAGSEEQVRDLFADLRRDAYEMAVQMRVDAAEAAFPPPKDPATGQTKRNKGRQDFTVLTINGRVRIWRRRWHSPDEGTTTPLDAWLDTFEDTISLGVREMACRLNGDGKNFDKAAANLARTAQVALSGETLRAARRDRRPAGLAGAAVGAAAVGLVGGRLPSRGADRTRIYVGSDGVMVPMVTDAEKTARRQKVKEKRRRRGRPLAAVAAEEAGADQRYKEFKIVAFYDEEQEHRLGSV